MKICGLNFGLLKLALNLKFMRFMKFGGLNLGFKFVEFGGLNFIKNAAAAVIARLDEVKSWQSTSLKFTKFRDLNLSLNFLNLTQIYQKIHALIFTQKFATAANQTLILNSPQKRAQNG